MKKKLIIISSVFTALALAILLIISILFATNNNRLNNEKALSDLLIIAKNNYVSGDYEKTAQMVTSVSSRYRVTIIDHDGTVLFDTHHDLNEENHLARPELVNIGSISYRYSKTLGYKMVYKAAYLTNEAIYIRIAIPEATIRNSDKLYALELSLVALAILVFVIVAITLFSRRLTSPLKKEINRLNELTGNKPLELDDDILSLSRQIGDVSVLLNDKINLIAQEKKRLNDLISNLNAGIIVLQKEKITLCNKIAAQMLEQSPDTICDKNYNYVFLDYNFVKHIEMVLTNQKEDCFIYKKEPSTYRINITPISNADEYLIFIYDITSEISLNQMKEDFFQNASHELKSPLTTILGYLQMIETKIITDPAEIDDALGRISKEAKRMNAIISEMLNLASLEANTKKDVTSLSMYEACRDVSNSFSRDIQLKELNFEIINEEDFTVSMNQLDLYHLISNLISNAIKYNKQEGTLKIVIKDHSLAIIDTGIGISEKEKNRIFERFYRVDKAKSKELGGTGLGLAIVKHIVNNYNLKLEVDSKENYGSCFKVIW